MVVSKGKVVLREWVPPPFPVHFGHVSEISNPLSNRVCVAFQGPGNRRLGRGSDRGFKRQSSLERVGPSPLSRSFRACF